MSAPDICSRCVMDRSDPEIEFDKEGHCNHCRAFFARAAGLIYHGEESDRQRDAMIERIRTAGKGRPFDCVVGVSGGVDSSYTAYLASQWGLRVLAVHLDNGWNAEEAVRNIQRLCTTCKLDYESYVLNWLQFRSIQLAFLQASIVELEMPTDVAIQGALHQVAARNRVPFILSGGNLATEGILPRSWFYYPKDSRLLGAICRRFGGQLKGFPSFDVQTELYYKFVRGIRILYPLNLVPYEKEQARATLQEHCQWLDYGGKHHESRYTRFVQSYIQPVKFGIDYRRAALSTDICRGRISRAEALAELHKPPYNPETLSDDKAYVAKKFGLSMEEFEAILQRPRRSYRDYPNNEKLLDLVYSTYRKWFGRQRSYDTTQQ